MRSVPILLVGLLLVSGFAPLVLSSSTQTGAASTLNVPILEFGPATAGNATTHFQYGDAFVYEQHAFGPVQARYWIFYNDGVHEGWRSSSDGLSYSPFSIIPTRCSLGSQPVFSYTYSGTTVYYACTRHFAHDGEVYFRSGALLTNGSIRWNPEETVNASERETGRTSITVDSNGDVWAAVSERNSSGHYFVEVIKDLFGSPSSSLLASIGTTENFEQVMSLGSGRMAVVYGAQNTPLTYFSYNGTSWSNAVSTPDKNYYFGGYGDCAPLSSTVWCAVGVNLLVANYYLSIPYNGVWTARTQIEPNMTCPNTCLAAIATDGSSRITMLYTNGTAIWYTDSADSGLHWSGPSYITANTETNVGDLQAGFRMINGSIVSTWESGSDVPFDVRVAVADVFPAVAGTPATQQLPPSPASDTGLEAGLVAVSVVVVILAIIAAVIFRRRVGTPSKSDKPDGAPPG